MNDFNDSSEISFEFKDSEFSEDPGFSEVLVTVIRSSVAMVH